MTLNTAQYIAPLNSQQVLSGYVQGVKQGTGILIQPDGTITLDAAGAAGIGFIVSNNNSAKQYIWPSTTGTARQILVTDGSDPGVLSWTGSYVEVYPLSSTFPHKGAAALPAGGTADRPGPASGGWTRYNTDQNYLEFYSTTQNDWLPLSQPTGGVFSFVQTPPSPSANAAGDFWFNRTDNLEYVWDGLGWVPTSPLGSTSGPGRLQVGTNLKVTGGVVRVDAAVAPAGGVSLEPGVVFLNDTTTSSALDQALTANQGRLLQLQINALLISNNLTLAGLISGAGVLTYVTPEGVLQGFTVGSPLPSASISNEGYFVIVESAGAFVPTGGVLTTVTQGDWFESTGSAWQFLNVGYDPPTATTTQYGLTRLATNAETQAGTLSTVSVTPAGLHSAFSSGAINSGDVLLSVPINGNTTVQDALVDAVYNITSTGNTVNITVTPAGLFNIEVTQATEAQLGGARVATVAQAQALALDTVMITPLKLASVFSSGSLDANDILLNPLINGQTTVQAALNDAVYNVDSSDNSITVSETAVGQVDVIVTQATETQLGGGQIATQAETDAGLLDSVLLTPAKLAGYVSNGQITAPEIPLSPTINGNTTVQAALDDAVYDISSSDGSLTVTETPVGQNNIVVTQATETQLGGGEISTTVEALNGTSDSTLVTPLKMRAATVYKQDFNAKGDLLSATANDTPSILGVGTNGQVLTADSTTATGLKWSTYGFALLDDISASFDGANASFTLLLNGVAYAPNPNTNLMVFLGGVPQIPGVGNAYTVAGSIITFSSPPQAGTTFYATTVMTLP